MNSVTEHTVPDSTRLSTPALEDHLGATCQESDSRIKTKDTSARVAYNADRRERKTPAAATTESQVQASRRQFENPNLFGYSTDIYGACIYRVYSRRHNPFRLDAV